MADRLEKYRGKRDPGRTPEPFGEATPRGDDSFVIQEHHARALHWDLRLERDGVLVSWAIPKGLPEDPKTNHLAVHTEDHPMEYADFQGEIPAGEYGAGSMTIWDRGSYETLKWSDREVMFVLHGSRVSGKFVLFKTHGKNWMIHRMDPPIREPLPEAEPMIPVPAPRPPRDTDEYAFEFAWGGRRVMPAIDGGRTSEQLLRPLAESFGSRTAVLDGEIVTLAGVELFVCYDLLYVDGRSLVAQPYTARRTALEDLQISGARWQTGPSWPGEFEAVRRAAREQGLPGIVAKRLESPYVGRESTDWLLIG